MLIHVRQLDHRAGITDLIRRKAEADGRLLALRVAQRQRRQRGVRAGRGVCNNDLHRVRGIHNGLAVDENIVIDGERRRALLHGADLQCFFALLSIGGVGVRVFNLGAGRILLQNILIGLGIQRHRAGIARERGNGILRTRVLLAHFQAQRIDARAGGRLFIAQDATLDDVHVQLGGQRLGRVERGRRGAAFFAHLLTGGNHGGRKAPAAHGDALKFILRRCRLILAAGDGGDERAADIVHQRPQRHRGRRRFRRTLIGAGRLDGALCRRLVRVLIPVEFCRNRRGKRRLPFPSDVKIRVVAEIVRRQLDIAREHGEAISGRKLQVGFLQIAFDVVRDLLHHVLRRGDVQA